MVVHSNIVNEGLISYAEWCDYIDSLKTDEVISDEGKAAKIIEQNFTHAVKKRLPRKKFGIFFSGGVDSTLIAHTCKKFTDNFICYTVGLEGSKDVKWSIKAAKELGLNHKVKIFSLDEMEKIFEETAEILGPELINIVNIGVGSVVLASIEIANVNTFFTGLGSEEIFAGYRRHENAESINEECWRGLKSTWKRDFKRDYAIADAKDISLLTPFLDTEVIKQSMKIDSSLKIKDGFKKYILRKAALNMGLKKEFAFRPKKAAQYGSKFDKAIKKIAKSYGFKYKKQYLDKLK